MRRLASVLGFRFGFGFGFGLQLSLLEPAAAAAEPVTAGLTVERAEPAVVSAGCDDRAKLERRLASILRRPATGGAVGARPLDIRVRFERDGNELVARVAASGSKVGVRTLRDVGPSCEALSEGVAVAVALLLDNSDSDSDSDERERSSAEGPQPSPTATAPGQNDLAEAPRATPPAAPSASSSPWQVRATLSAAASYGLAGTWLGLGRLGARNEHWLLDLGVSGSLPVTRRYDDGDVSTSLLFGSVRGCYLLGWSVALGPCAQIGVGRVLGSGDGYGETREVGLLWSAASLGLGAELPLAPRVSVSLEASLWLPLQRLTFSVQNRGTAWESKLAAGLLGGGLTVRLF